MKSLVARNTAKISPPCDLALGKEIYVEFAIGENRRLIPAKVRDRLSHLRKVTAIFSTENPVNEA